MSQLPLDERVAVLETEVAALKGLPAQIGTLREGFMELRSDVKHIATGAAALMSSVDELRGVMGARATQEAAAGASHAAKLDQVVEKIADLRADNNRRAWPPAAKATVAAGVIAAVASVVVPLL